MHSQTPYIPGVLDQLQLLQCILGHIYILTMYYAILGIPLCVFKIVLTYITNIWSVVCIGTQHIMQHVMHDTALQQG